MESLTLPVTVFVLFEYQGFRCFDIVHSFVKYTQFHDYDKSAFDVVTTESFSSGCELCSFQFTLKALI